MKLPKELMREEGMAMRISTKDFINKFGGMIASLALLVTALNVNTTCAWIVHQPKLPEGARKLRKF
ncbi:MAG: hypothetical protein K0R21_2118 [Anaerocolumna sp.]|jgi:cyclic lactone autoinducer peptide|nr:hypothetical protein [Anaerocolumna sp.]